MNMVFKDTEKKKDKKKSLKGSTSSTDNDYCTCDSSKRAQMRQDSLKNYHELEQQVNIFYENSEGKFKESQHIIDVGSRDTFNTNPSTGNQASMNLLEEDLESLQGLLGNQLNDWHSP